MSVHDGNNDPTTEKLEPPERTNKGVSKYSVPAGGLASAPAVSTKRVVTQLAAPSEDEGDDEAEQNMYSMEAPMSAARRSRPPFDRADGHDGQGL